PVCLFALSCRFAWTRATTIELPLNFGFGNFDPRRATINHHADAAAMGLAECGDAEQLAKCVGHWNGKLKTRLAKFVGRLCQTPAAGTAAVQFKSFPARSLDHRSNEARPRRRQTTGRANR